MSCLPGMPCYEIVNYDNPCYDAYYHPPCPCPADSDNVLYVGPDLYNSGINKYDSLTVCLQKIDAQLNAYSLVDAIISNPVLVQQLCTALSGCAPTTTTTTTNGSTTTTTTTSGGFYTHNVFIGYSESQACSHIGATPFTIYSSAPLGTGVIVYYDAGLTQPFPAGAYGGFVNEGYIVYTASGSTITNNGTSCTTTTTTTTFNPSSTTTTTTTLNPSSTTTTTTTDPFYYYTANQYFCPDCNTIYGQNVTIKGYSSVPNGQWVIYNPGSGFVAYQIISPTTPSYMATLVDTGYYSSTCPCPATTTTTTTTSAPVITSYRVGNIDYGTFNDACANSGDINGGTTLWAPGSPYTVGTQLYYDVNFNFPYAGNGWVPAMTGWPSGQNRGMNITNGVINAGLPC
jgi:hypothetical protein